MPDHASAGLAASSAASPADVDINDFTAASAWEQFVAQVEQQLHAWHLSGGQRRQRCKLTRTEFASIRWVYASQPISFARVPLLLHHCHDVDGGGQGQAQPSDSEQQLSATLLDSACGEHDFASRSPPVTRMFGLREFLVISGTDKSPEIGSLDRVKLLLSSAVLALGNTGCHVPFFVQVNQAQHFVGVAVEADKRIDFDMVCLARVPSQMRHLSGLLSLFKEKLGYASAECPSVCISVRFVKVLRRSGFCCCAYGSSSSTFVTPQVA